MSIKPTVSIICLTYNQEKYVRDCLDGFVMQQTSFPYEVLIYDDASTDGTPTIIQEYAEKYPSIFKPTLYKKNNYSQGLGYVGLYTGIKEAKGKYVAYCEGDDYWTDPQKLQKQVDFLETHPDYVVCAHETIVRYSNERKVYFSKIAQYLTISSLDKSFTFNEVLKDNIFHISSLMYRNFEFDLPSWINETPAADMVIFRLLAERGAIYVMQDAMSVYRDHEDSLTNSQTEFGQALHSNLKLYIPIMRLLNRFWNRKYQKKIYPLIAQRYAVCALLYTNKSIRDFSQIERMASIALRYDWLSAVSCITKGLVKKICRINIDLRR